MSSTYRCCRIGRLGLLLFLCIIISSVCAEGRCSSAYRGMLRCSVSGGRTRRVAGMSRVASLVFGVGAWAAPSFDITQLSQSHLHSCISPTIGGTSPSRCHFTNSTVHISFDAFQAQMTTTHHHHSVVSDHFEPRPYHWTSLLHAVLQPEQHRQY